MRAKVIVVPVEGGFTLRTENDFPVGQRMLSVAPKKGSDFPVVPDAPFRSEFEANKAKLDWNTYLLHAEKTKSKSRTRTAE